jgi:hypothetical protein
MQPELVRPKLSLLSSAENVQGRFFLKKGTTPPPLTPIHRSCEVFLFTLSLLQPLLFLPRSPPSPELSSSLTMHW